MKNIVPAMGTSSDYNEYKKKMKQYPTARVEKEFSHDKKYIYERHYYEGRMVNGCILAHEGTVFVARLIPR